MLASLRIEDFDPSHPWFLRFQGLDFGWLQIVLILPISIFIMVAKFKPPKFSCLSTQEGGLENELSSDQILPAKHDFSIFSIKV